MAESEIIEVDAAIDVTEIVEAINNGKDRIEQEAKGFLAPLPWDTICDRLAAEICDELGKDLMPWLGKAWTTLAELHEFKDTTKYPPGSDSFYDIVPHSIEGVMHPRITIRCAGEDVAHLPFDITVAADFHCAALVIRDAHILGFGGGDYSITLKIALFGQDLGKPIDLYKSRLPGKIIFKPGLPIL